MDTLLYNGDFARDGRGISHSCSGAQELVATGLDPADGTEGLLCL